MAGEPHITTVIVAAGSGSRFGGDMPKQFRALAGRPLLMHTVDAFRAALPDSDIVLVLSADATDLWYSLCRAAGFVSPRVVTGGDSRWRSVKNALESIESTDIVLVHDGARPLVDAATIHAVIKGVRESGTAVPVVPVTDSLRRADTDQAVDRSPFRAVQTPQGFDYALLNEAYSRPYRPEFTDDASVVESIGHRIAMTEGSPCNIKVTYPMDIAVAEAIMAVSDKER